MKEHAFSLKTFLSELLLGGVTIYGASWLGFLVAMLPAYIVRWNLHESQTETEILVTAVFIVLVTALILMFLYRRNDATARSDSLTLWTRMVGSPVLCALLAFGGNLLFSPCGFYVAWAVGTPKEDPSALGFLIALPITTIAFAAATYAGYRLALRKRARERAAIVENAPAGVKR